MSRNGDRSLFTELRQSLREAVAIATGEQEPSRVRIVGSPDDKAIRALHGAAPRAERPTKPEAA